MSVKLGSALTTLSPAATVAADASQPLPNNNDRKLDAACIAGLIGLAGLVFYKALFCGAALSKIVRLATWDSAFESFNQGVSGLMDPSLVQLMVPYYMLVAKFWHAVELPLWNPYNACGVPLLADPQANVLSPLHAVMAFWPTLACYNKVLVGEVALALVGTFLLARSLSASRLAAIMAAVSFAFCPFIDWFMELLGTGYMLFPLVLWLFTRACRRPTLKRAALAGVGAAVLVLSGHPEAALYGTASGAVLTVCLLGLDAFACRKLIAARLVLAVRQVCVAGVVAFCLAAPMILPFGEYLRNSDCYKFGSQASANIPLPALLLNLLQPALGGASLYLGVLPVLCLPFCFLSKQKRAVYALLIVGVLCELFTAKVWPINALLRHTPLATLVPNYCQPIPLLAISLLAAIGYDRLTETDTRRSTNLLVLGATAAAFLGISFAVRALHIPLDSLAFDSSLGDFVLDPKGWQTVAGITAGLVALIWSLRFVPSKFRFVVGAGLIAVSFIGQFAVFKRALALQPPFDYAEPAVVHQLSEAGGRSIALTDHLLKPNNNAVFEISDLRIHNPMFPQGYRDLVDAMGAHLDQFNAVFSAPLKAQLSVASIAQVTSDGAVWSQGVTDSLPMSAPQFDCQWPVARVESVSYAFDQKNAQIVGKLRWAVERSEAASLTYTMVIMSAQGKTLWFGDAQPIDQQDFGVAIPAWVLKQVKPLVIGVKLFDTKKLAFLKPSAGEVRTLNASRLFVCDLQSPQLRKVSDPVYTLAVELPTNLRVYRNMRSLPDAYTVTAARTVASQQEAIAHLKAGDFAWQKEVLLESSEKLPQLSGDAQPAVPMVALVRRSPNHIEALTADGGERVLVFTDTFYPGWQARVDGDDVPIYRANGFFRGIIIRPGVHKVQFAYRPLSFYIGVTLAGGMALLLISAAFVSRRKSGIENESFSAGKIEA